MVSSEDVKKSLKIYTDKIADMRKADSIVNGAVDEMVAQFAPKSGSGTTGSVPNKNYAEGNVNDGVQVQEAKKLESKSGSGASVGDDYLGQGKDGKYVMHGTSGAKEQMIKCSGGKMPMKPKSKKSVSGKPADAKSAGVPAPKKSKK